MNITMALDMKGCPNRCRHCWLGHMPNKTLTDSDAIYVVEKFKKHFKNITFYSWLREPDFLDDYKSRWQKDNELSNGLKPNRFELASFYRINRDKKYIEFLKDVNVKTVQLTLFGLKKMIDKYVGRKGAFEEIINATNILIENGINVRWQAFINEENKQEIEKLIDLINELKLKERCNEFTFFIHEGTCDGENRKLYDIRIKKESISKRVSDYYLDYKNIKTEKECCELLKNCNEPYIPHNNGNIVINVTNDFDLYYNFTNIHPAWKIGNIRMDDFDLLAQKIINEDIDALNRAKKITIAKLVNLYGDLNSHKVFQIEDYKMFLLNRYLEE